MANIGIFKNSSTNSKARSSPFSMQSKGVRIVRQTGLATTLLSHRDYAGHASSYRPKQERWSDRSKGIPPRPARRLLLADSALVALRHRVVIRNHACDVG
jgi:hypothetical protein